MSKRDLKKYLSQLDKEQLQEQITDLYQKFKAVKVFYDFVFNPNEAQLLEQAKVKISHEYFPAKGKWPKMRRGTAQKLIKHFQTLGVDPYRIGDLMFYNLEIAQTYSAQRKIKYEAFYKSMLNSYQQALQYMSETGITPEFRERAVEIEKEAQRQKWPNAYGFALAIEDVA